MSTEPQKQMNHREAWEILPWYVNGSLDGSELERFESHLAECEICRHELSVEERWAREIRASEELVYSPQRAFSQLAGRLAESERSTRGAAASDGTSWWRRWFDPMGAGGGGALRWAAAVQAVVILVLVGVLWIEPEPAEFRTVSDTAVEASVEGTHVRVVFEEQITEAELRTLLLELGAQLVDGPSRRGVYSLEVTADRFGDALERLRDDDRVLFAEPR